MSPYEQGLVASLIAGLATGIGGIPVLLGRRLPHRLFDAVIAFAAGVMLAVSGHEVTAGFEEEWIVTMVAAAAGGLAVLALRMVPVICAGTTAGLAARGHRVALVVSLHNLVEGLMVIAAYARSGPAVGLGVAVAIAAHNIPEGLAVAEPLRRSGLSGWQSVGLAALSGLGEPLGALLGATALSTLLPASIGGALAAGAMIVLAAIELIPEAFSHSFAGEASAGLLIGVVVALSLLA